MSEQKLEPCSCGGEAKVIKDVLGFWAVECKDCLTRLGVSDTKEEIIEAWNDMRRKEMSEEKLKPCPFCGGKAKVASDEYRQEYINPLFGSVTVPAASKAWAYCTECGAMGRVVRDKDYDGYKNSKREERLKKEAVKEWNKRVADVGKTSIIV